MPGKDLKLFGQERFKGKTPYSKGLITIKSNFIWKFKKFLPEYLGYPSPSCFK